MLGEVFQPKSQALQRLALFSLADLPPQLANVLIERISENHLFTFTALFPVISS